jgi:hypothetical protein
VTFRQAQLDDEVLAVDVTQLAQALWVRKHDNGLCALTR